MAIVTTAIIKLLLGTLSKIFADEVKAWLPSLGRWLLAAAVARLPEGERERYREEWEADLLAYPGEVIRCFRALGMYRASAKIRKYDRISLRTIVFEWIFWRTFRIYLWIFFVTMRSRIRRMHRLLAEPT